MIQFLIAAKLFAADWFLINVVNKSLKKSIPKSGKLYFDLQQKNSAAVGCPVKSLFSKFQGN